MAMQFLHRLQEWFCSALVPAAISALPWSWASGGRCLDLVMGEGARLPSLPLQLRQQRLGLRATRLGHQGEGGGVGVIARA